MKALSSNSGHFHSIAGRLAIVAILATTTVGCLQSTEPDIDGARDGLGEFEGQIDPGANVILLKQVEIVTTDGIPVRIELVGRFVRPATGSGDVAMAVGVRNVDQRSLYAPAEIVLSGFQPSSVAPAWDNPDWTTCPGDSTFTIAPFPVTDQCLYGYNYSELLGADNVLTPGELSGEKLIVFMDPTGVSFAFNVQARFGLSPNRPRIAGLFYSDNNRNGRYDEGEPPFGGGWVHVAGPGLSDLVVSVNGDGRYAIPVRETGLYSLWAMPPPTFAPVETTTSNPLEVVILAGSDGNVQSFLHADFGWTNSLQLPPVYFIESTDSLSLDQYAVDAIDLHAQVLSLRVGFSGCSPDHPLNLYMVGGLMESFPPQARLILDHDDRGELCDAYFERDLAFDLWPILRLATGPNGQVSPVIIHFEAWDGQTYTYELNP
jgi:hypothetical protein